MASKAPNTDRKAVRISFLDGSNRIFYNCPKCGKVIEHRRKMHKNLCMRCGQYLDWSNGEKMQTVWIRANDPEEAAYWAGQYEYFHGSSYAIDINEWRLIRKEYPILLYFSFPEGKGYGRFMRKAAKEAKIVNDIQEERL